MPVLPIFNTIAVPGATLYLRTDGYRQMTGKPARLEDKVTLIVAKKKLVRRDVTSSSFYPIGITGIISEIGNDGFMQLELKNRVNVNEVVVYHDHSIDLDITKRYDVEDMDEDEAERRLRKIKDEILRFAESKQWSNAIRGYLARWNTIGEIAAGMSPWMVNSNKEKYDALAEDSVKKRFKILEDMIYENLQILDVNQSAKDAQEEEHQKLYRESAIRRQMEHLQKELDELHPEEMSDLRKLELKLEESGMNEEAKKEGRKVLNRLKAEGQNSVEAGLLRDYMEFLTDLPWNKAPANKVNLEAARRILEEDHFGLEKVKKRIIQQLAVMSLKGAQTGSILLFVGAPGTGKTSIGSSIARALGREYTRVSLGGVRDEADIRGHRRTYIGAMPGRIIDAIHKCGVSNPVMVLDEVDKLSVSYNGDPASALLEVLDPEQNAHFTDHYLNVPYDLSDVFFVCTANTVDMIPAPLLNRMEVIPFQGYTPIEKKQIALRHLLPKARNAVGIKPEELEFEDGVIERIITEYTRESGVRGLKKCLDMICRSAAVDIVISKDKAAADTITPEDNGAVDTTTSKDNAVSDSITSGNDAAAKSETEKQTETETETEKQTETETEAEKQTEAESEAEKRTETEAEAEKQTEAKPNEEAEKQTDTEANAGAGAGSESKEVEKTVSSANSSVEGFHDQDGKYKKHVTRITLDNLQDFMDRNPIHRKNVPESAKPGIVTGLAWTQVGGEILYIETMFTKGSGRLIITGRLGDVMKESAQIAVSIVKSMFPEEAEVFEKNDLHIHVPDGATPKDGPSAGITLTTALASLVTGKAVPPTIAMTGEVSLRGDMNPIGGLPEKLMAAHRAGVKKVFIPKDNEEDLRDVPDEVKTNLEILPVEEIEDVLRGVEIIASI